MITTFLAGLATTTTKMNRFNLRGKFPSDDQRFPYVAKLWAVRMVGNHCNDIRINGKDDDITEDLGDLAENSYAYQFPYTNSTVKKIKAIYPMPKNTTTTTL
ncbi:MAG: hypothetical protein IPN94_14990 [Sphingobacteriales bacterium]|nr:hypothetical protein [Sphingobacteriales bacterium]